jgi:solute carrier family 10 (sodium/bile acid cotransporter), member 7
MFGWLRKRWFLVFLLVLIPGGLSLGSHLTAARVDSLNAAIGPHASTALVILILFLMSVTLDNGKLRAALSRPGPVLWASFVNMGLIPLAAWPMSRLQMSLDFQVGFVIAASVPSTMAAASVWTRKAGGNDAVSLLVTLLTNSACFAVTPLWLKVLLPPLGGSQGFQMETGFLMQKLLVSALLPIVAGQLARLIPRVAAFADRHKIPLGVVAQGSILVMVFSESIKAGPQAATGALSGGIGAIALVWLSCMILHLAGMLLAVSASRVLRFEREDRAAIAFAASQKTLPIGVYIAATFSAAGAPLAVLPMLMYHASQLFLDTAVADQLAAANRKAAAFATGDPTPG